MLLYYRAATALIGALFSMLSLPFINVILFGSGPEIPWHSGKEIIVCACAMTGFLMFCGWVAKGKAPYEFLLLSAVFVSWNLVTLSYEILMGKVFADPYRVAVSCLTIALVCAIAVMAEVFIRFLIPERSRWRNPSS